MTNINYSVPSATATSVQKRRTLYIAKSDPRNNENFLTNYKNDYYGNVEVLEDDAYKAMLVSQSGIGFNDDEEDEEDFGGASLTAAALVDPGTVLHPPTLLWWDLDDESATRFIQSTGKNQVDIKITFDPGDSKIDGVRYVAEFSTTQTGSQNGSSAKIMKKPVDKATITFLNYSSTRIRATWAGLTDAVGYTIILKGANAKTRAESQVGSAVNSYSEDPKKRIYYLNYNPNSPNSSFPDPGYLVLNSKKKAEIDILPVSGKSFSGTYTISFIAVYTNGAVPFAESPKATFTIGGGAPTIV